MEVTIIKNYRENEMLRCSFCELAMKTFGIDFESWYENGFWTDRYNPYSVLLDGRIVANVSVNRMEMYTPGKTFHFIQLGTVMTDEKHRNKGYIRMLMEEIFRDYEKNTDGFYLFANDTVCEFYPKFGFEPAQEFRMEKHEKAEEWSADVSEACYVPLATWEDWDAFQGHIERSVPNSRFEMRDNAQLAMFYLSSVMKDNLYYVESEEAFSVAEISGNQLFLTAVYADHIVDLNRIIAAFGKEIEEVKLGFTPLEKNGFVAVPYKEEDCTLFLKGKGFEEYRKDMLRFPVLSHA
ncbi:MAG: GNAT family N-acetyltransferase [Clostridiales bacterium]|nr:GNAT family N-acetyltransferase [Clostridiales bacterium]